MVQLTTGRVLKNGADQESGRASAKVATVNMLGLGKRKPVRQLKKAGVILKTIQQRLQIHISGAKIRKEKLRVKRGGKR
jgi:hypothetical protein